MSLADRCLPCKGEKRSGRPQPAHVGSASREKSIHALDPMDELGAVKCSSLTTVSVARGKGYSE